MSNSDCLIDLHLHLDGAISLANAKSLLALQPGLAAFRDFSGVEHKIPADDEGLLNILSVGESCADLNDFLRCFALPCALLQSSEALECASFNLCEELRAEGVAYAEIRFAPQLHCTCGMTQDDAVDAVLAGMSRSNLNSRLILCCMRGASPEANMSTVTVAAERKGTHVVAIDLAGAEGLYPTADHAGVFAAARDAGVPFTVHAGEADGPESVAAALDFGAVRIGHGVRAIEDPGLVRRIVSDSIPMELCPKSNLDTKVFSSIEDFPLRRFLAAGAKVTINTDDPAISGTSLRAEWRRVTESFSLTPCEVRTIMLNSVDAAFADETTKAELRLRIMG